MKSSSDGIEEDFLNEEISLEEPEKKKHTFIDEDLKNKFFSKEESKSDGEW